MIDIFGPDPETICHRHILDFLAIRKTYFVDNLGWPLTHTSCLEWDQYDIPQAKFAVAYKDGECVGGARLLPTNSLTPQVGAEPVTYMLADFVSGRIRSGMHESDLTAPIPRDGRIWEMTRFVAKHPDLTGAILDHVNNFLHSNGAQAVLTLSPLAMPRVLHRLGYETQKISRAIDFDGREYVALLTRVRVPTSAPSGTRPKGEQLPA